VFLLSALRAGLAGKEREEGLLTTDDGRRRPCDDDDDDDDGAKLPPPQSPDDDSTESSRRRRCRRRVGVGVDVPEGEGGSSPPRSLAIVIIRMMMSCVLALPFFLPSQRKVFPMLREFR
jgi:hypothetical protein